MKMIPRKEKLSLYFFVFGIFVCTLFQGQVAHAAGGAFAGGNGTGGNPYQIEDCLDLQAMNGHLSSHFILNNNIDCSATIGWNGGAGFDPIGDANPEDAHFVGTFDGQGHTVDGLFINRGGTNYVGLFALGEGATITHVGVINADITGDFDVGAVIGGLFGATASKLWSSGSVTGNGLVGGVIGSVVGGGSTLSESYSSATVDVDGGDSAGGLVGANQGTISNSYSVGSVDGNDVIGGLVGDNSFEGIVQNSYAVGAILSHGSTRGGLVGSNTNFFFEISGTVTDSFYDADTTGQNDIAKGTGKTTSEMRNIATFTNTATDGLDTAWDFVENPNDDVANNDYWDTDLGINSGYPFLTFAGLVDETGPSAPTDFAAVASSTDVNISWTNPVDIDFLSLTIRRGTTSTPTTIDSGLLVAEGVTSTSHSDLDLDEGIYYYSIFALDIHGNISVAATTSVKVDITAPVITLLGDSSVSFRKDTSYTDAGATASDNIDGDITDDIVVNSIVNSTIPGTYTITYTVSDDVGNAATPVVRTVTVTRRHENSGGSGSTALPENTTSGTLNPIIQPTSTPQIVMPTSTQESIPTPISEEVPVPAVCVTLIFSKDLRIGSTGDDVKKLQQYLNNQGFVVAETGPGSKGNETGYFGNFTLQALINFQKSKNITEDLGVLNEKTRELLGCASFQSFVESVPPRGTSMFTRNLQMGMAGEDVRALQVYLNTHGYVIVSSGPGSRGSETTYFGSLTKDALIRFQQDHSIIPASGYFGSITQKFFGEI